MIGRTLGHYRIVEKLGAGGMGVVYKARDLHLDRFVALKTLPPEKVADPDRKRRFVQEAKAASALNHANIVHIYDITFDEGVDFIAMEYVEGKTLDQRIGHRGLRLGDALKYGVQIADALAKAHSAGIVHRDLKPSNLMVNEDGVVKVLDFGLAKLTEQTQGDEFASTATVDAGKKPITERGTIVGTVAYMSPEQAEGRAVDVRSDIFSFGSVLYEMVTGRKAFRGDSKLSTLAAILRDEPVPIGQASEGIPQELERVITRCLRKDPVRRYQHMDDVKIALEELKEESDSGKAASRAGVSAGKPWISKRLAVGLAVAALLIVAGIFFWPGRGGVTPVTEANSVVVLPCKVYGAKESDYLTDAIPGSLSTLLAKVEGLETKAPIANAEFESIRGDLGKAAALYKVERFVQLFVTADSDRMVLNAQLLDAKTRRILWSKEYPGRRDNYLELVQGSAEDLRQKLQPGSRSVRAMSGLAANSEAELIFRQAKYYSNQYNNLHRQTDFERAFSGLKRALELDPRLADAAAEIAYLFIFTAELGGSAKEAIPEAISWARRAVGIDPRCGLGWGALCVTENYGVRPDKLRVLEYGLKAACFAPAAPMVHMNLGMAPVGTTIALETALEAHRMDALYLYGGITAAALLWQLGRPAEGLPYLDEVLSIEPNFTAGLLFKFLTLADLGRLAEAADMLKKAPEQIPEGSLFAPSALWAQYALALQQENSQSAEALLRQILRRLNDPNTRSYEIDSGTMILLPFLVRQGQMETALHLLTRSLEAGCFPLYDWLVLDPRLEPLRRDQRFKPILEKSRKDFEELMRVLAQARSRGELPRYLEAPFADLLKKLGIQL